MSVPFHARALFPYDAVEPTELSVAAGDDVVVEEVNESGWCLGKIGERTGWLPTDYIERIDGTDGGTIETSRPQPEFDNKGNPTNHSETEEMNNTQNGNVNNVNNMNNANVQSNEPMELVLEAEPEIESVSVESVSVPSVSPYTGPSPPQPTGQSSVPSRPHVKSDLYGDEEVVSNSQAPSAPPVTVAVIPTPPPVISASNGNPQNTVHSTGGQSSRPTSAMPAANAAAPAAPHASSGKVCDFCKESIRSAFVMAKDKVFHPQHFQCSVCHKELGGKAYLERDDKFYCEDDYYSQFNPRCAQCEEVIKGPYISALGQTWHPDHFTCTECHKPFPGNQFRKHDDKPYCEEHFAQLYAPRCAKCSKLISGQVFEALENKYHLECFTCSFNEHAIGEGVMFHIHEGKIFCPDHFEQLFLSRCSGCGQVIKGQYIKILEDHYHTECWKCSHCQSVLRPESCGQDGGRFYCKNCITNGTLTPTLPAPMSFKKETPPPPTTQTKAPAEKKAPVLDRPNSNGKSAASFGLPSPTSSLKTIDVTQLDADSVLAQKLAQMPKYEEPSNSQAFPYELLKTKNNENRPQTVDPAKREQYLSNEEFFLYFKMGKEEFMKLPQWKRENAKKAVDLF